MMATPENKPIDSRPARYGFKLFLLYLGLYATFMLINVFAPSMMEEEMASGINWAVGYGLGLIVSALGLALIYAWMCREVGE